MSKINENVSLSWFGSPGNQLRCPVEGCDHMGTIITKAHCRLVHNMEREEVKKKYGMPTIVRNVEGFLGLGNKKFYNSIEMEEKI